MQADVHCICVGGRGGGERKELYTFWIDAMLGDALYLNQERWEHENIVQLF